MASTVSAAASRKTSFRIALRAVITLSAVALLYLTTDLNAAVRVCLAAKPNIIFAALALSLAGQPLLAWRWQIILRSLGISRRYLSVLRTCLVSTFVGLGLPAATGSDLVRGLLISSSLSKPSRVDAIVSVFTDRAYGLLTLSGFSCAACIWLIQSGQSQPLVVGIASGCVAFWILVVGMPLLPPVRRLLDMNPSVAAGNRLRDTIVRSIRGVALPLSSLPALVPGLALSALVQLLGLVGVWIVGTSVGLHLSVGAYFAFVPVVWLVTSVPISIAGIGVREASFVVLFGSLGVTQDHAAALGVLNSAIALLVGLVGGLAILMPDCWRNDPR